MLIERALASPPVSLHYVAIGGSLSQRVIWPTFSLCGSFLLAPMVQHGKGARLHQPIQGL